MRPERVLLACLLACLLWPGGVLAQSPPAPLAYYAMDEPAWAAAGDVRDSALPANDGSPIGAGTNTVPDGYLCRGGLIPDNANDATVHAVDTGIDVDADIGGAGTLTFWYRYAGAWDDGERRVLLDASNDLGSNSADKYFYLAKQANGRLNFELETADDAGRRAQTSNISFAAGEWHHLAISWNFAAGRLRIYVDGGLAAEDSGSAISQANFATLYLGDVHTGISDGGLNPGQSADGVLDEARVYASELSAGEIAADRAATHSCAGLAYFLLNHDQNGVHCLAEQVTLTAIGTDGNPLQSYDQSVTLDTQTGVGNWALDLGQGSFADPAPANDGRASYSFAPGPAPGGDAGTARFLLSYAGGPLVPSAIDVDAFETANPGLRDDDTEGPLAFQPSGLVVTASALPNPPPGPIADPIPVQTAGTVFALHLTAFGQLPADPECGVIESYAGPRPLQVWSSYLDPGSGSRPVQIDPGSGLVPVAASEPAATLLSVPFSAGQAQLAARYKDVGRIRVDFKDTSVVEPATGIRGATNPFVVLPADFAITALQRADGSANPGSALPPGAVFVAAGSAFRATVEVRDAEGDLTPNYGSEATVEGLRLGSAALVEPAGGRNGSADDGAIGNAALFAPAGPAGTFSGSAFYWDEVGAIQLRASVADGSYLDAGDVLGSLSGVVGRFVPDHFSVAYSLPQFATRCPSGGFSYLGEPFDYAPGLEPVLTATAENLQGGATANYTGSLLRLSAASLSGLGYTAASGTLSPAAPDPPTVVDLGGGRAELRFESGPALRFDRAAPVAPISAEISLSLNVLDADAVAFAGNPARFGAPSPGAGIAWSAGGTQRWGRAVLENAHGPEHVALAVPFFAEYFDGAVFVANGDDSCTPLDLAALSVVRTPAALPTTASLLPSFLGGSAGLSLSAPGLGNPGTVQLGYDLGPAAAARPWLRFDWDGDGAHDDDPAARATFGVFAGAPPLIYLREQY